MSNEAKELIGIKEAARDTNRSEKTIRRWVKSYRIGRQATPNSPYEIFRTELSMVVYGDFDLLMRYQSGERASEDVLAYTSGHRRITARRP